MQRFTIIEGWRGILAWWVVFSHTLGVSGLSRGGLQSASQDLWAQEGLLSNIQSLFLQIAFYLRSGKIPVYVFVIISGFVIVHLLTQKKERYDVYLIRRFFRLWPALMLALLIYATCEISGFGLRDVDNFWGHFALEATMFHGLIPDQIFNDAASAISGPGWSISLEWQFYIVAPLIIGAFTKGGWRIGLVCAALLLLAIFGMLHDKTPNVYGMQLSWSEPAFVPQLIGFFGIGMVSYALLLQLSKNNVSLGSSSAIIIAAMLIANAFKGPEGNFLPLMIWTGVFVSILTSGSLINKALDNGPLRFIGTISYSTYIIHMPFLMFINRYVVSDMAESGSAEKLLLMICIAWPIVFVVSLLSYYYVEKPGVRFGKMIAERLANRPVPKIEPESQVR